MDSKQSVAWLRQSAPYINAHRGKTFVLMLSGEAIAHPNFINTIHDIALLNSLGIRLVLTLGARPQIEQQLKTENLTCDFVQGMRVTSEDNIDTVIKAISTVRTKVEALLSTGIINSPMHGAQIDVVSGNFITAQPIGVRDGIDFGLTGEVRKVASSTIQKSLKQSNIVIIPCMGYSPSGETFNLSIEDVATKTASAIHADKLITLCDKDGAENEQGTLLRELTPGDCASLINSAISTDSQQQALRACYQAINSHIPRAHIISYANDGALLAELLTRDGSGTLITQSGFEQIRSADINDVGGILQLIEPLEEQGVLVRRSRELLETEITNFTVIERDGMIVSCIALYPFANENMGEVACVATHPDYQKSNRAGILLQHVERQAKEMQIDNLFVLTTQTAHWFLEKGFAEKSIDTLPEAKQKLYNFQRNSKIFIKKL